MENFDTLAFTGGVTTIEGALAANAIEFAEVELSGDTVINATDMVSFGGDVYGMFGLEIIAGNMVMFGGDLGRDSDPLQSLIIRVNEDGSVIDQNLIVFGEGTSDILSSTTSC